MNAEIRLKNSELYIGGLVGVMRRTASMQNGNDKNKHAHKSDWSTDADGACAEMAASKYLSIYWEPKVNAFKSPDLSNGWQVRSTNHQNGHLIVRGNDSDSDLFLLVVCNAPIFRLVGCMMGHEAKVEEFLHVGPYADEARCWWVPQNRLRDLPSFAGVTR